MEIYDLRRGHVRPQEFENILSPIYARKQVNKCFYLEKSMPGSFDDFYGHQFKKIYGLRPSHPLFISDAEEDRLIGESIDNGYLIVVDSFRSKRNEVIYPFFISESGELFCVNEMLINEWFVKFILNAFRASVLTYGRPSPTRSDYVPINKNYGPGYWRTINDDYHALSNLVVMAVNRATSMGDEGRMFMSDGKDFMHTTRDKIQKWSPLTTEIDEQNKLIIHMRSVIRRYGETRQIHQRYLESDDAWTQSGTSWQWIPGVSDEDYEFKK